MSQVKRVNKTTRRSRYDVDVDIIIPAYNCASTIGDTLESILNQTYPQDKIHILIVNDGSTDSTDTILEKYRSQYSNIQVVKTENQGVSKARNVALSMAKHDYIEFVDSDDKLEKNTIETFVKYQKKYGADVIKGTFNADEDTVLGKMKNKWVNKPVFVEKEDFVTTIYPMIFTSLQMNNLWTLFIKRELISDISFDTEMTAGEDLVFVIDLITKAKSMLLIPDAIYSYNQNTTNSVTRKSGMKRIIQKYKDNKRINRTLWLHLKEWGIDTPMYRNLAKSRARNAIMWKLDRRSFDNKQLAKRKAEFEIEETVKKRKSLVPVWIEDKLIEAMHTPSEDGTYPNWQQIKKYSTYYELRYLKMPVYEKTKRLLDIVISLLMIIVLSPIMLITAIIIYCKDGKPIIYKQTRLAQYGRPFTLYKFRSMPNGIEKETGAVWSNAQDDRATSFGKFIRRYKIDELPQLFNILKGDMSFVGCRPERPEFYDKFKDQDIKYFDERILVTPGLTGLAQIKGGTRFTPEQKLAYDLEYIRNRCLKLDIKLFISTVTAVFKGSAS